MQTNTVEISDAFERADEHSGPRPEFYQQSMLHTTIPHDKVAILTGVLARLCSYVLKFDER